MQYHSGWLHHEAVSQQRAFKIYILYAVSIYITCRTGRRKVCSIKCMKVCVVSFCLLFVKRLYVSVYLDERNFFLFASLAKEFARDSVGSRFDIRKRGVKACQAVSRKKAVKSLNEAEYVALIWVTGYIK